MFIITTHSLDGKTVYFDGHGFTLLRQNAKEMAIGDALSSRRMIAYEFPSCDIVGA